MTLQWQPINPHQHPHHQPHANVQGAGAVSMLQGTTPYVGVNVSSYYFTLDAMLDLGFKTLAQFRNHSKIAFFMLEVACYTDEVVVQGTKAHQLLLQRSGVGFRIGVASWNIDFTASSTLAAVAANAQLNTSRTALEVNIYGASLQSLSFIKPLLTLTDFTPDTLLVISTCGTALADYFAKNGNQLTPVPLAVAPLDVSDFTQTQPAPWFNDFYTSQFSMESIYRGKSVNQALIDLAGYPNYVGYVVPTLVRGVYSAFGIGDDFTQPDAKQKQLAWDTLTLGRF